MARYDFRCRTCGSTFEVERPMAQSSDPAVCPDGHADTVKLLNLIATVGVGGGSAPSAVPAPAGPMGGGCCGGACHAH
ncbi:MAG: zinc ribbon domain-containing protein [Microthrixaceae bacterium]|nr:zinc ribbon domain-containing protein [Actinomycetota bacterium]